MQNRYSLRFESGERQGETVPLSGRGFLVGRKPGSSLQIVDGSVSGRHAEFDVHEDHVLLRDLGSTNGTRIGTQRVLEQRLNHGEKVLFGNVELTFLDADFDSAPAGASADEEAPELGSISAEKLAAAGGRRSIVSLLVVVLLVGVLGGVWYFSTQGEGAERKIRPVQPVAGNELDGYSFESELSLWTAHEASTADFLLNDRAAYSGETGLRAVVAESEWALHRSEEVSVKAPGQVQVQARIDAAEDAEGRIGVEFLRPAAEGEVSTDAGSLFAWSQALSQTDGSETVEFSVAVPAGFATARVVLFATGDGRVDADDISLVTRSSGGTADLKVGEFELRLLGPAASVGVLHKVDRFLLSDLRMKSPVGDGAVRGLGSSFQVEAEGESALRFRFDGKLLAFFVEPDAVEHGIGTIGEGGYQVHSADFERANVDSLLIGIRKDLVRLKFPAPVKLIARPDGARLAVNIDGLTGEFLMQLDFHDERVEAGNLAYQARKQDSDGLAGACITTWTKLLDDYPYESALVAEAEEARARLTRTGLREVREVELELERGSFFRLVEIYRKCRENARQIATRYAGTVVEEAANDLIAEVDRDVAGLERDLQSYERGRLEGIRRALLATEATSLATEVERYLEDHLGGGN